MRCSCGDDRRSGCADSAAKSAAALSQNTRCCTSIRPPSAPYDMGGSIAQMDLHEERNTFVTDLLTMEAEKETSVNMDSSNCER